MVGAALVAAGTLSACGGSSGGKPAAGADPAAAIDPSSDNTITGPVNRARAVADDAEARDRQLSGAGEP